MASSESFSEEHKSSMTDEWQIRSAFASLGDLFEPALTETPLTREEGDQLAQRFDEQLAQLTNNLPAELIGTPSSFARTHLRYSVSFVTLCPTFK